jgi:hypothetical protein
VACPAAPPRLACAPTHPPIPTTHSNHLCACLCFVVPACAADWTSNPLGIVVAMEDASLRGLVLDSDIIERCTLTGVCAHICAPAW